MREDELFEMSNIRKTTSGLPVNIYVSSGGSVNSRHGPRIKVMTNSGDKFNPNETVSVMLKKNITEDDVIGYDSLPPNVLIALRKYINVNFNTLMKYWNDEIDTAQMIHMLRKI